MTPLRRLAALASFCGLLCLASCGAHVPREAAAAPDADDGRPRLAVVVVFDQLRGDYLTRWNDLFGQEGFRRLERDGAWFQNCHYPYAETVTGAGHASIATGCSPATHGIISNDWYDRAAGEAVNCVESDRYRQVPPAGRQTKKPTGVSPERLLAPTLGDALKAATGGQGRVVSLSFKDRSAALPGGRQPDACYWLDATTGTFVTSTYYRDRLPSWVEELNRRRTADRWFGHDWTRLRPGLDYERWSGPDDVAGEGRGIFQGRTFPHPMTGGLRSPGGLYYQALYTSPFGNDLLLDLVERAVDAEQLGRHASPDLLCVSFSSNDPIGHVWGPDSQEVLDVTLRSDLIVQQLLATLDARVGRGRYLLALTADHGVCPLPEVSRRQGKDADRIPTDLLLSKARGFLNDTFSGGDARDRWFDATPTPWIYLNQKLLARRGLQSSRVEEALAGWLRKQSGIQSVYTRTQLLHGVPADDAVGQAVRRSFHPDRSGDLMIVLKPYWLFSSLLMSTTHGTPHPYDTHVPLLVLGPGVRPGVRQDRVTPQAAAAILARGLGIDPPAKAEAPVPESLFSPPETR
jgi:predicted AlkP superfamily pyrophosphatase or phosphodiesterase